MYVAASSGHEHVQSTNYNMQLREAALALIGAGDTRYSTVILAREYTNKH